MDLSNHTNDELADLLFAGLIEAEKRAAPYPVLHAILTGAHKLLDMAQRHALKQGEVSALRSDGGPKE